ncbi:CAP domain-containing protein [Actinomadura sp. KC345]|uniref:CAP domain-containing protein n=1 Tax=Actinomadura sp. KC345 TaxID=2530371 RepID=UPI00104EB7E9|nr:CAP domain-containing protein [Actinomadura sp. KC345]TDC55877.1 CAP domain-containing protein [Actinomadura sp. KC345]
MSTPHPPRSGGPGPRRRQRTVSGRAAAWTAAGAAGLLVIGGVAGTASGAFGGGSGAAPAAGDSSASPAASPPAVPDAAEPSPTATATPTRTRKAPRKTAKPRTRAPRTTRRARPRPARTKAPAAGGGTAAKVIALVNKERAKRGCRAVTSDAELAKAAQGHSADMARRGFFSHTSPDGRDPGARITATGYRWSTYGENIAKGQPTPASVMNSWMNSPGHRKNILNCGFAEIGIGVVTSGGPGRCSPPTRSSGTRRR